MPLHKVADARFHIKREDKFYQFISSPTPNVYLQVGKYHISDRVRLALDLLAMSSDQPM